MILRPILLLLLLPLLMTGCPSPGGGPTGPDAGGGPSTTDAGDGSVQYTVPAAGGAVEVPTASGSVSFTFPASAAGKTVRFSPATAAEAGLSEGSVQGVLRMEPSGTSFSEPVLVRPGATAGLVVSIPTGGSAAQSQPLAYDAAAGAWQLHHFSFLAWMDHASVGAALAAQCETDGALVTTPDAPACTPYAPATTRWEGTCSVALPLGCFTVGGACCVQPGATDSTACAAGSATAMGSFVASSACGHTPGDTLAPEVSFSRPAADPFTTPESSVLVEGSASDSGGLERLTWQVRGEPAVELPLTPGATLADFSFTADLLPGDNVVQVHATDRAGNTHSATLTVVRDAPVAPAPTIVHFSVDRPSGARPGEPLVLTWEVRGATSLYLSNAPGNVTGLTRVEVPAPSEDTEYWLSASNDAGSASATVWVDVDVPLRTYPAGPVVVVVPGARQRVSVENSYSPVTWTASAGATFEPVTGSFSAAAPGTYTLHYATPDEPFPREGTLTFEVREVAPRVERLEGIGGQLSVQRLDSEPVRHEDTMAVDTTDVLWAVPGGPDDAMARLEPVRRTWEAVSLRGASEDGASGRPLQVLASPTGEVWVLRMASSAPQLLRFAPGSLTPQSVPTAWAMDVPPDLVRLAVGGDGGLWALVRPYRSVHEPRAPYSVYRRAPGATTWTEDRVFDTSRCDSIAVAPDGDVYTACYPSHSHHVPRVQRRSHVDGSWSELPQGDLLTAANIFGFTFHEQPSGLTVYVTSPAGLLVSVPATGLVEAHWEWVQGGLPNDCSGGCPVYDVDVTGAGALVVATVRGVYQRDPGDLNFLPKGVFPAEWDSTYGFSFYDVDFTATGELYAGGSLGVYRFVPGATHAESTWVSSVPGMPSARVRLTDLAVAPDGSLAVGTQSGDAKTHQPLYRRPAAGGPWTGFGSTELGPNVYTYAAPMMLDFDAAGRLYGATRELTVFRVEAGATALQMLPALPEEVRTQEALTLHATADGTLFLTVTSSFSPRTYTLAPGATGWVLDEGLSGVLNLVETADGTLWVRSAESLRRRTPNGPGWEWVQVQIGTASTLIQDLDLEADGGVVVASSLGVLRLAPGATQWEVVGTGTPSTGTFRVAAGGGRLYASVKAPGQYDLEELFELDRAHGTWVPLRRGVPGMLMADSLRFAATPDGHLLLGLGDSELGLLRSVDAP